MAAIAKPEISKKWWKNVKPDDIKGADLLKGLDNCESALATADKKKDAQAIKAALAALANLNDVIEKTIKKECDKKKHKELIDALHDLCDLVGAETKELENSQESQEKDGKEDEEEDKGVLKEEYRDRMIKQLRSGKEVNFCFGLNKSAPEQSRLVLCIKRKPERLYKILKQTGDFSNRLMTFGTATGDGKVLQFNLSDDAKEPSQIAKLAKEYLKSDRSLKFKKLRVLAGGQTFEEEMPDSEGQGEPQAASKPPSQSDTATQPANGADAPENLRKEFKQARSRWVAVRDKAERDLEAVKDGIRDHYLGDSDQFPIATKKMKELDEIMENLNHDLRDALDAYVSTPLKQQDRLHAMAGSARQLLERYMNYVNDSPLLAAIDHKEFANVEIQRPMFAAMRDLAKTIK